MRMKRYRNVQATLPDGTRVVWPEAVLPALPIATWRRARAAIEERRRQEALHPERYEAYKRVLFSSVIEMAGNSERPLVR
jgi:hypothetical protein